MQNKQHLLIHDNSDINIEQNSSHSNESSSQRVRQDLQPSDVYQQRRLDNLVMSQVYSVHLSNLGTTSGHPSGRIGQQQPLPMKKQRKASEQYHPQKSNLPVHASKLQQSSSNDSVSTTQKLNRKLLQVKADSCEEKVMPDDVAPLHLEYIQTHTATFKEDSSDQIGSSFLYSLPAIVSPSSQSSLEFHKFKYSNYAPKLQLLDKNLNRVYSQHQSLKAMLETSSSIKQEVIDVADKIQQLKAAIEQTKMNHFIQKKRAHAREEVAFEEYHSKFEQLSGHLREQDSFLMRREKEAQQEAQVVRQKQLQRLQNIKKVVGRKNKPKSGVAQKRQGLNKSFQKNVVKNSNQKLQTYLQSLPSQHPLSTIRSHKILQTQQLFQSNLIKCKQYCFKYLSNTEIQLLKDFENEHSDFIGQRIRQHRSTINRRMQTLKDKIGMLNCCAEYQLYLEKQDKIKHEIQEIQTEITGQQQNSMQAKKVQRMAKMELRLVREQQQQVIIESIERIEYEIARIDQNMLEIAKQLEKQKQNEQNHQLNYESHPQLFSQILSSISKFEEALATLSFQLNGLNQYYHSSEGKKQKLEAEISESMGLYSEAKKEAVQGKLSNEVSSQKSKLFSTDKKLKALSLSSSFDKEEDYPNQQETNDVHCEYENNIKDLKEKIKSLNINVQALKIQIELLKQ